MSNLPRRITAYLAVTALVVMGVVMLATTPTNAQDDAMSGPLKFTADGELNIPPLGSWRTWPFLGTPVTPQDMNKDKAAFPEFHHVYMYPAHHKSYSETGVFPEGTVLCKELVTVGKKKASSGRGYFEGEFNGFEIAHKSKKMYPDEPGNWAYYSFEHHAPPYAPKAKRQPTANCASCHEALADEDMVFSQYYPNLRAAKPSKGG
ncbi:MAG: cytochrome P460 family protein [Planctomycetota bacterium]